MNNRHSHQDTAMSNSSSSPPSSSSIPSTSSSIQQPAISSDSAQRQPTIGNTSAASVTPPPATNRTASRPQVITQTFDLFFMDHPDHGPTAVPAETLRNSTDQENVVDGPTLYFHFDGHSFRISDTPPPALNESESAPNQSTDQPETGRRARYNLRPRPAQALPSGFHRMFHSMFAPFGNTLGRAGNQRRQAAGEEQQRHRTSSQRSNRFADNIAWMLMDILMLSGALQPHMQGQPPASTEAKNGLRTIKQLTERQISFCPKCLICLEEFPVGKIPSDKLGGDECVREMPCKHLFHQGCIFHWLGNSNQCPTCRYEILTDNQDYNTSLKDRMAQRDAEILKEDERIAAEEMGAKLAASKNLEKERDCVVIDLNVPESNVFAGQKRPRSTEPQQLKPPKRSRMNHKPKETSSAQRVQSITNGQSRYELRKRVAKK